MEKKSLLKKCPDEDEASSSKSKKDDNNPPRGRPPKSKNSHSAWSFYPGGGKTLFGSFQRVRVEGRRGRGYWEWKAAEHKKNLYDEDDETYVENNSRGKGRVTFQGVDEGKDVARSASADKLKSSPSSRAVPPGGVRVLPSSVSLQEDQLNRKSKNSDLSPVERIKVSSFAQPRLTPMLDRVKPLIEPPSTTPSPPSGIAPTAPPKELLYADSKQRRAARSQPVVGQDHQSLMCQDSSKYPRDKNTQTPTGNVVQGSTKAQVYSDLGLSYPEGYRQYYLNQQSNGKNLEVQDIRGNNESKQSTYTDHSESSLNTSRNDNTLSSIASLSSNKQEPQTKSTPHNSKVNNSSALLRQKQATTDLKRQPPLTDARKSGALVWISQPGGGAKLDWVPTPGLATLRGVPASPLYANVKGRISSQSKQGPIKGEVAASSSSSFPPKGIIKRGDEGGGGGGRGGWGKESPRAGEGKPSSARAADASTNPRVGANGGGISRSSEPSIIFSGDQSKNVLSSAPGVETAGPAGRTCTASSDVTGTNSNIPPDDKGDKIVTVAGRGQGQTVRIRVRPEVHAYLSTLPIISSSLRGPEPPSVATDRDSVYSANSSSGSGLTLGSGEGSIGYQEQGYQEVVDEYTLLKKAVDYHDPEALRLLSAVCSPESGSSEYPYLREMKERLLIAKETPGQEQLLEIHQTPVGTVVKLNADGYHTSPTHRVESLYTGTLESRKTQAHEYFPKNAKTSTFITLSLLYATLCVVVCLGFVLSEVLTHNVPLYYYEAFFTYMYGMSIFFLLYVFCYLLSDSSRDNTTLNNQVYMVRLQSLCLECASPRLLQQIL